MSRSTFALRFKETVGVSPMEYLTRWRMLLAGERIANTSDSISEIAQSFGYESASAFTKAFKKIMGCSPRQYSHGQNSVSPEKAFCLRSCSSALSATTCNPESGPTYFP